MKKSFIITSMAACAALCFSLTAQAQGPVVVSDKDDYAPGETALFQATGFQPGELLDFSVAISDENGAWVPDIAWADVAVDGSGSAEVDYVVPDTWANKRLQLSVMGLTSGLMATTTFTDVGPAFVHNVNFSTSGPLPAGTSFTVSGTKVNPFGNNAGYSDTFITPASSSDEGTLPFTTVCFFIGCFNVPTNLTFTGFPTSVPGTGGNWVLSSFTLDPLGTDNGTLHDLDVSTGSGQYLTGGQNTGSGHVHSTIVGNYMFVPTATPNSTPVITPMNGNVNLGQIVGCLDGNNVIATSVAVAYSVAQTGPKDFNVNATFNGGNQTLIATIHDNDGNLPLSGITLTPSSQNLTFTGAGTQMLPYSTFVTATDTGTPPLSDAKPCPLAGSVATVQVIYGDLTFLSPLSGQINTKVKQGSGIPVKFTLMDGCGNFITTGDHTIDVARLVGITPDGEAVVDDAGMSGDGGDNFRYDPTGMLWIFNLKTNSTYQVGNTYKITATLDDETTHDVFISIKR